MINLYAALLGGRAQPDGTGDGECPVLHHALGAGDQGADQQQLEAGIKRFADVFDERLAEAVGEHLPTAALEALADAESLLEDVPVLPELLGTNATGELPTDGEAASDVTSIVAQSTVWRLQAALHAAAHGLAELTTEGDVAEEVLVELGDDATTVAALAGLVGLGDGSTPADVVGIAEGEAAGGEEVLVEGATPAEGEALVGDEASGGEDALAGDEAVVDDAPEAAEDTEVEVAEVLAAAPAAASVAANAAGQAVAGQADGEADAEAEGEAPASADRLGARQGSGRTEASLPGTRVAGADGLRAGERTTTTGPVEEIETDGGPDGGDPVELRAPGREGRAAAGGSGESLTRAVRGERLGGEAPMTTSPTESTATTTPRSEVAETGAMRPSAAAATLERVLEAAARLDKMPPPRQLTLELGDSRVRLGIEDGVLRVQLVGESQPEDRALLRDVTAELRSRGFDLGPGDGRGEGRGDGQPEAGQQPTPPGGRAGNGAARSPAAMPTNATTDLRL